MPVSYSQAAQTRWCVRVRFIQSFGLVSMLVGLANMIAEEDAGYIMLGVGAIIFLVTSYDKN